MIRRLFILLTLQNVFYQYWPPFGHLKRPSLQNRQIVSKNQGLVRTLTCWPLSGSGQVSTSEPTSGLEEHSGSKKMLTTGWFQHSATKRSLCLYGHSSNDCTWTKLSLSYRLVVGSRDNWDYRVVASYKWCHWFQPSCHQLSTIIKCFMWRWKTTQGGYTTVLVELKIGQAHD